MLDNLLDLAWVTWLMCFHNRKGNTKERTYMGVKKNRSVLEKHYLNAFDIHRQVDK